MADERSDNEEDDEMEDLATTVVDDEAQPNGTVPTLLVNGNRTASVTKRNVAKENQLPNGSLEETGHRHSDKPEPKKVLPSEKSKKKRR